MRITTTTATATVLLALAVAGCSSPAEPTVTPPASAAPGDVTGEDLPSTTAPEPSEPEPTPSETTAMGEALGATITITGDSGEVDATVSRSRHYPKPRKTACTSYMADPENGRYLVFDVTMKVTSGTGSINPLFFEYVDDDGNTADAIGGAFSGCGHLLDSGNDMPKGTKRAGQVVFDAASTKGEVVFTGPGGDPIASWRVA